MARPRAARMFTAEHDPEKNPARTIRAGYRFSEMIMLHQ
jgi:hypothetical protein